MGLVWKLFLGSRFREQQNARTISHLQQQCQTRGYLHEMERSSPIVYNTTLLSPQIFEASWDCLHFEMTQTVSLRRDADLAGATEQYQRQLPFRKGGS